MLKLLIVLLFVPLVAWAELDDKVVAKMNSDLNRVNQIKLANNPKIKDLDILVAEKNKIFLEQAKKRLGAKELEAIKQDIGLVNSRMSKKIEVAYLAHLEDAQKKKPKKDLLKVVVASNKYLQSGIRIPNLKNAKREEVSKSTLITNKVVSPQQPSKEVTQVASASSSLDAKDQADILANVNSKKTRFKSSDEDSLFLKISKAYYRNIGKVIEEKPSDK